MVNRAQNQPFILGGRRHRPSDCAENGALPWQAKDFSLRSYRDLEPALDTPGCSPAYVRIPWVKWVPLGPVAPGEGSPLDGGGDRHEVQGWLDVSEEGYSVSVPALPGCWSQGANVEEALANIADAIREYLEAEIPAESGTEIRESRSWCSYGRDPWGQSPGRGPGVWRRPAGGFSARVAHHHDQRHAEGFHPQEQPGECLHDGRHRSSVPASPMTSSANSFDRTGQLPISSQTVWYAPIASK